MVGKKTNFIPFRRTKPGFGAEHHTTNRSFFSADVTINVFTYDENSYTEGSYKTVDEIPNIPSEASSTSIMCK